MTWSPNPNLSDNARFRDDLELQVIQEQGVKLPEIAQAALASASAIINKREKYKGKRIWCTELGMVLLASGVGKFDPWVDGTGIAMVTPT